MSILVRFKQEHRFDHKDGPGVYIYNAGGLYDLGASPKPSDLFDVLVAGRAELVGPADVSNNADVAEHDALAKQLADHDGFAAEQQRLADEAVKAADAAVLAADIAENKRRIEAENKRVADADAAAALLAAGEKVEPAPTIPVELLAAEPSPKPKKRARVSDSEPVDTQE
jgi:hypothetical protein